jgi:hypothetical protein
MVYTYLTPSAFPTLFVPDLSRHQAEFEAPRDRSGRYPEANRLDSC